MINNSENMNKLMNQTDYIRNISIIAHVDHGKTALTESLAHVYMDIGEEKERGITIKSAAVSLKFSRLEDNDDCKNEQIEREYLINLIDSPGHLDFNSEVSAALRITDGAICVVDCIEGVKVQTNTVLKQAILERVKPVLFLNKIDRIWLEKKLSLQDTYNLFRHTIESVNVICSTYNNNKIFDDLAIDPIKCNMAFGSGYFGYGFTLSHFAKLYSSKFSLSESSMCKKLWGSNYYNEKTLKWQKNRNGLNKNALNGFCQFILYPLQVLHESIMDNKSDIYLPIISSLGLNITMKEINKCLKQKDLLRLIMSKWFPAKNAVLDLCADHLPSPIYAQSYRISSLYSGPLDTPQAQSMRLCNKNGCLSMYISKMIPIRGTPRFIAFGRVFSGTVKCGQELMILTPNGDGDNDDISRTKNKIQGIVMMHGQKTEKVSQCPAGNICGLIGMDQYLTRTGTLTDSLQLHPFKTMKLSVCAVVKVAVDVCHSKDLKKLLSALQILSKYDSLIKITKNKQQQNIIAGAGELHLETCINTLKSYMNDAKINVNEPIVSFCEGIKDLSGTSLLNDVINNEKNQKTLNCPNVIISKSTNKHNRLYVTAQPISSELCTAIENDDIPRLTRSNMKSFSNLFCEKFPNWNKKEVLKIWSFGCAPDGKTNIIIDETKGVQYLDKIRDSICNGFNQITLGGVLCDEPLRGTRFNVVDAKIHSDPPHHGSGQIIPMTRRALYAAQLASCPVLYEPMYLVEIDCPINISSSVYNTISCLRGNAIKYEDKTQFGILECKISAHIPIIETFKNDKLNKLGFTELLRKNTDGKAFAMMKFSHWKIVEGNPLKENSKSNDFIKNIRKRKGIKTEIPSFYEYYDRL